MLASSRASPVAFAEGEIEEEGGRFSGTNVSVCVKSSRKQPGVSGNSSQRVPAAKRWHGHTGARL